MFLFYFYVPESHLELVKNAVFEAGAGAYNDYDCCCWSTKGLGQFRPLKGSNPFLGKSGIVEGVVEYKVETVCSSSNREAVLAAFYEAHPYEEPAFGFLKMEFFEK